MTTSLYVATLDQRQLRQDTIPEWDLRALPPLLNPNVPLPEDPIVLARWVSDFEKQVARQNL
jgi:hypothetical protein